MRTAGGLNEVIHRGVRLSAGIGHSRGTRPFLSGGRSGMCSAPAASISTHDLRYVSFQRASFRRAEANRLTESCRHFRIMAPTLLISVVPPVTTVTIASCSFSKSPSKRMVSRCCRLMLLRRQRGHSAVVQGKRPCFQSTPHR